MSIINHFSVDAIRCELEHIKEVAGFSDFLWLAISETFQISAKYAILCEHGTMIRTGITCKKILYKVY